MTKRISCTVINSVPLGQINAGWTSSVKQPSNHPYEIDDITNPRLNRNQTHNSKAFDAGLGIINAFPIGQILDCCA